MDSGVSALDQFQQQLNVIGNNIANVDTSGFKSANMEFATAFSQTIGTSAAGSEQIGTGVLTSSITNDYSQGAISTTGIPTNLAVNGPGFFLVKDPSTGQEYATRDGNFAVDKNGFLVTSTGMRVQGYTDSTHTAVGDIQLNNPGTSTDLSPAIGATFDTSGNATIVLSDDTTIAGGQVLLQNFTAPTQLISVGNNLYTNLSAASPIGSAGAPGSNGLGNLATSSLEMSNVDLAGQLTSLITTQRAYEANTKVITTSDEILQDLVNLKR